MNGPASHSRLSELAGDSLELRVLSGISRVLVGQREVAGLLEHILQVLEDNLGFRQGALCLLQEDQLVIEASYGLSDEEKALFDAVDPGPGTIAQEELLEKRLPEMPVKLVPIIEQLWQEEVVGK